jgi:uncharacterized protein
MSKWNTLRARLSYIKDWPQKYMFKFIVPADMDKIAKVEALFHESAVIYRKESQKGNFISITAKQNMDNAEQIIDIYEQATKIENIVSL